ncbi:MULTISPECIES: Lpg1974 family pore-forming outer membrane protein [Legionella]|uniref:Major outer membrane protein n=1 Tax=Legionella quinlivanii TaxID=45073 RepID=A0A364LJ96_9GAMM|nr:MULTISPECIES: Lpg1974 family pore-forming outer membrane protein [Legionella]MCE3045290.1 hypothetical protein [Legionella sp. 16cNR16C]RAP36565.1 hypothetical protein B1207_07080 [Legionella quinlivanii]
MLKKMTLAVLGLTVSSMAAAGMYSEPPAPTCTPGDVTVPCEAKQWDLGIQALYLQPIYSASRGYRLGGTLLSNLSSTYYNDVDPDWGWGYRLEGSYHFRTGNDITATWMHYDADSKLGPYFGPFYVATTQSFIPGTYRQYVDNRFDQVNVVMGQHVDFGLLKNARFYGGLQYADIQVDATNYYNLPLTVQAATFGIRTFNNTDFNGVGPVIGIDYSYDLSPSFSITANTAGSILYGTSRINRADVYNVGLVALNDYGSKHSIVPSFEAKLGANYAYPVAQGVLNIQGGYHVLNYFNALQDVEFQCCTRVVAYSDFGLYGPYLGLKWVG